MRVDRVAIYKSLFNFSISSLLRLVFIGEDVEPSIKNKADTSNKRNFIIDTSADLVL